MTTATRTTTATKATMPPIIWPVDIMEITLLISEAYRAAEPYNNPNC